jgi:hypothetical protein
MKKQTAAKAVKYKGVDFKSKIERDMYKLLYRNKIPFAYEKQKFEIDEGFNSPNISFERFMNGKGLFKNRGDKQFRGTMYTPDFTPPVGRPLDWVIEVKGRSFPDFPRTWRLFKKFLSKKGFNTVLFVPRNLKDCNKTILELKKIV